MTATRIYSKNKTLQAKVTKVLDTLARLRKNDRYKACLIFGSVVRGEFVNGSDIDVKVIVGKEKEHSEVNHVYIEGIKLDISFNSLEQIQKDTETELKSGKRIPIVCQSIILFDKDGKLKKLSKEAAKRMLPTKYEKSKYDFVRFLILNEDMKVRRNLVKNPAVAQYVMHTGLSSIIEMYYKLAGQWHVSNKKTFSDLKKWDPKLQNILVKVVSAKNSKDKFLHWTNMIDHILNKVGGRVDIEHTSCNCEICLQDMNYLNHIAK